MEPNELWPVTNDDQSSNFASTAGEVFTAADESFWRANCQRIMNQATDDKSQYLTSLYRELHTARRNASPAEATVTLENTIREMQNLVLS